MHSCDYLSLREYVDEPRGRYPIWLIDGLEFREFVQAMNYDAHLLLLRHSVAPREKVLSCALNLVSKENLPALSNDSAVEISDFVWVDIASPRLLEKLSPLDQAELLYFGNLKRATDPRLLHRILRRLRSRFLFASHDGAYHLELHSLVPGQMPQLLGGVIAAKCKALTRRSAIPSVPPRLMRRVLQNWSAGISFSFSQLHKNKTVIQVPFYENIGQGDSDDRSEDEGAAKQGPELTFTNGKWILIEPASEELQQNQPARIQGKTPVR